MAWLQQVSARLTGRSGPEEEHGSGVEVDGRCEAVEAVLK